MKTKAITLWFLTWTMLATLMYPSSQAAVFTTGGTLSGALNGYSLNGTTAGGFDSSLGTAAYVGTLLDPWGYYQWNWINTLRNSPCTIVVGDALKDVLGAQSLLDLAPNGHNMNIQYWWSGYSGGVNGVAPVANTWGSSNSLSYSYNLTGIYGGPMDLQGVTSAGFRWTNVSGTGGGSAILETGTASVSAGPRRPSS